MISLHRREATTQSPDKGPDAGHARRYGNPAQTPLDNNTPLLGLRISRDSAGGGNEDRPFAHRYDRTRDQRLLLRLITEG